MFYEESHAFYLSKFFENNNHPMLHEALIEKKTKTNILTIGDLNLTYIRWSWTKYLIWLALYENYINGFSPKTSFGQVAIVLPKMMHRHNFESTLTFFFFQKSCTMEGSKRYIRIILMVFWKKIYSGEVGHFGPKNDT